MNKSNVGQCDQCHKVFLRWVENQNGWVELDCPVCEHRQECGEGHTRRASARRDRWSDFDYSR